MKDYFRPTCRLGGAIFYVRTASRRRILASGNDIPVSGHEITLPRNDILTSESEIIVPEMKFRSRNTALLPTNEAARRPSGA